MASWNEKLIKAARDGSLTDLKLFIEKGADLEYRGENEFTPLLYSVYFGHIETVQYLVSVGSNKEAKTKFGFTPLLLAVQKGNLDIVQCLITAGCQRNARTNKDFTPLLIAVQEGHIEIVQYLVTAQCNIESRNKDDFTPFLFAVQEGHLEIVEFLVKAGCNIESKTKYGFTPLLVAAKKGHPSIVLYLIEVGCVRETRSKDGRTALHVAAQYGNLQVTKVLIEEVGISPFEKTYQGKTPYQLAAETNRQDSTEKRQEKDEIMDFLKNVMLTEKQKVSPKVLQQQGLLQVLQERIIQDIQISQVLDYMMSHLVISSDDRRRIEHYAGQDEQNKALLGVVNKRGEPTYSVFVDALRTNGYTDLANELECDSQEEGSSSALVYTGDTDNKGLSNWTVPVFKIRLQKNYSNIINSILHGKIVDHLISRDVLSTADSERIDACPAKIEKIRKLMDILLHGSENGFIEFLNALREDSEYTELAGEIENTTVSSRDISTMQSCFK